MVDKAQGKILTEQQFNSTSLKNVMSYQDYCTKALKLGSAFTFARAFTMQKAEQTSDKIRSEVDGWYVQKEQNKADAAEQYYAALAQYETMKSAQDKALKNLNYATIMYGEDSSKYNDALKKYNLSNKTLFGADTSLSIARDKFNFANGSAFKAYLSTQLT